MDFLLFKASGIFHHSKVNPLLLMKPVLGLRGKVLVAGGCRDGLCEKRSGTTLIQPKLAPDSSKMDLLLNPSANMR